jgi:NADP-dependent 3-hydroxy acid dehydrogenase YdfG
MTEGIEGKIVVITGASSGLGAAAARRLASEGARVVLGARRADRLQSLVDEIQAAGGVALSVPIDVTQRADVQRLVAAAVNEFGRLDVILNNAGLMPLAPFERLKVDEWDQMIDVNVKGVLYGIAAALPQMQKQRSGQIINVSSVYGHIVAKGAGVYCGTKWAVRAISEGLRQEVKPYNVRTTIISPGAVATDLLSTISDTDVHDQVKAVVDEIAIPADSFARMVSFAISQPEDVDVSEIIFRPTAQPE